MADVHNEQGAVRSHLHVVRPAEHGVDGQAAISGVSRSGDCIDGPKCVGRRLSGRGQKGRAKQRRAQDERDEEERVEEISEEIVRRA